MNSTPEIGTAYVSPVKLVRMEGGYAYGHVARLWSADPNAFGVAYSAIGRPEIAGWFEAAFLGLAYAVSISPGERLRAIKAGAVENDAPGPVAGEPNNCRTCHRPITWALTAKGRKAPYDADGRSHFATCPQANEWRRRR